MLRCFLALLLALNAATAQQAKPRKIYISVDMEGIAGVVSDEQLGPKGFEYQRAREFMTEEVNAAIRGVLAVGPAEFIVSDSHGNGQNLLIDKLPRDGVTVVRGLPRPLSMMAAIDATFDGVLFIGYHASTTNPRGVRAHTFSSALLTAVRLNGIAVPEAAVNAAVAGHFGVPVLMVSGDDVIAEEAVGLIGPIETAVVKWALGFHSARAMHPAAAQALIEQKAKRAVERIKELKPYRVSTPVKAQVSFKNYRPVEALCWLPLFERVDAHTVGFTARDMPEASRIFTFLTTYEAGLEP